MSKLIARLKGFYIHNKVIVLLLVIPIALYLAFTATYLVNEKILNKKQATPTNQPVQVITDANKATANPVTATEQGTTATPTPTTNQSTATNKTATPSTTKPSTPTTTNTATTTPSTPATTPPTVTPPYVKNWGTEYITLSPNNCGEENDPNKCSVGQTITATVGFKDIYTGRKINITNCVAYGYQSQGPQTTEPRKPATATKLDSSTCRVTFIAPNYGKFFIYLDAYTDENTPEQYKPMFTLAYLWFQKIK